MNCPPPMMKTEPTNSLAPNPLARIRQDIQSMHAYAVQDSRGLIKLDAMENPHRLPPALQAELGRRLGALALNRYPDARVDDLRRALADYAGMPAGCDIMLGNGSDELISLLAMACDIPGASILAPVPGFVLYAMSAKLQGLAFHGVPLTPEFELDEAAMLDAVRRHRPSIVYLAYPNNPTANLWDDAAIAAIIDAQREAGGLVVMDEAYQPFSSRSWIDRMRQDPARHAHVLLLRTLSKFGLAGVRLGYLIGPATLVREVDKVRPPYNISVLNYECALFALEHSEVFAAQAQELRARRAGEERFYNASSARQLPAPDGRHRIGESGDAGRARTSPMTKSPPAARTAEVSRMTAETRITVKLNLDGTGVSRLATGIGFFDHMLDQIARHGLIDLDIQAEGDLHIDGHHTVEDVGITLGQALYQAVGDKPGIRRYGHAYVPLDEALSRVVVDFSGRPGLVMDVPFRSAMIGSFDTQLAHEFFQGFVNHAFVTLHIDNLKGANAHHQAETVFKAFGRALRQALA